MCCLVMLRAAQVRMARVAAGLAVLFLILHYALDRLEAPPSPTPGTGPTTTPQQRLVTAGTGTHEPNLVVIDDHMQALPHWETACKLESCTILHFGVLMIETLHFSPTNSDFCPVNL